MLPHFIIVGPQRTGSTWLHECLAEHPQVCLPKSVKETFFFDRHFHRGAKWYEGYFSDWREGLTAGEIGPTYFSAVEAPSRIRSLCPGAKIVACLRDPVKRSWSAYLDAWRKGDTALPFERAIDEFPGFLDDSLYTKHLERYYNEFGKENILVLIHEDIHNDYEGVLSTLYRFIGVDDSHHPVNGSDRVYMFRPPRSRILAHASTTTVRALHSRGLHSLVNVGKVLGFQNLVYSDAASSVDIMSEGLREDLEQYFRDEVRGLSTYLNRDLEALWLK